MYWRGVGKNNCQYAWNQNYRKMHGANRTISKTKACVDFTDIGWHHMFCFCLLHSISICSNCYTNNNSGASMVYCLHFHGVEKSWENTFSPVQSWLKSLCLCVNKSWKSAQVSRYKVIYVQVGPVVPWLCGCITISGELYFPSLCLCITR